MHDFERFISTPTPSGPGKEELRVLGKKASIAFVERQVPLNESIAGMAKEAGLNEEQIKRVVEFANNDTFATMFREGFEGNITFPMADASAVGQSLASTEMSKAASRVDVPSQVYLPGQELVDLESAFACDGEFEKAAAAQEASDLEISNAKVEFLKTASEHRQAESDKEVLGTVFLSKMVNLQDMCKQAHRDGYSAGTVGAAIEEGGASQELLTLIQDHIGKELVEYGHKEKLATAGIAMMPGNPITGLTDELMSISQKLVMAQSAITKTQMAMSELLAILRGGEMQSPTSRLFSPPQGAPVMPAPAPAPAAPMPAPMPPSGPGVPQ